MSCVNQGETLWVKIPVGEVQDVMGDWLDAAVARLDGERNGIVFRDLQGVPDLSGARYKGHMIVDGPDECGDVLLSDGGIVRLQVSGRTTDRDGITVKYRHVEW